MLIIICLTKQTRYVTCQFGYGGVLGCCLDPVSGYQMLSSYFYVFQVSRQTYIETMQPKPFEEWIEKGHQRYANLCSAYARPTNERSLVRGRGGYNQGSFVYFGKACGDVEGRAVLSDDWDKPRCAPGTGSFLGKIQMAARCRDVAGEEVGVKCGCMQRCCESARPGVRSWQAMAR